MWTVQFMDYLQWEGVKEGIKEVKKAMKSQDSSFGFAAEEAIINILNQHKSFDVQPTTPQMDIGFGADARVAYEKDDKNFSFYIDITTTQKDRVSYLKGLGGGVTSNPYEAFVYKTEYFNFRIGIKESHASHFFYEKPVIVLYIEKFVPCTGIAVSHLENIVNILISANEMLFEMGFGARASKKIRPNLNRFRKEYVETYVSPNNLWGDYIYNLIYKANLPKGGNK